MGKGEGGPISYDSTETLVIHVLNSLCGRGQSQEQEHLKTEFDFLQNRNYVMYC
jgi:hypothetical protein